MQKYATAGRQRELAAAMKFELALIAMTLPETYQVTGKQFSRDGNRAQMRATAKHAIVGGTPAPMFGVVDMAKVQGVWKVDKMGWANEEWPAEEVK